MFVCLKNSVWTTVPPERQLGRVISNTITIKRIHMETKLKLAQIEGATTEAPSTEDLVKRKEDTRTLIRALCSWYVRKDSKFHSVNELSPRLSRKDIENASVIRFNRDYPDVQLDSSMLKAIFKRAIESTHVVEEETIPVWNGRRVCDPEVANRVVWKDGMVSVNTWLQPHYRTHKEEDADLGVAGEFLDALFVRENEKAMFLNWLAWCLQNEGDKPTWAPFLYSKTKGSGKSTLCKLVRTLFGEENSITQNNVDKLTGQFNATVLLNKLVVCEELQLPKASSKGNALKTYITEKETTVERKGVDAEPISQRCCFLFTTNHLPSWIEEGERRYYLIEIDHDGHASGSQAKEFSDLVGRLYEFLEEEKNVASVYQALMERRLPKEFSAKSLNAEAVATDLMKRIASVSEDTILARLREELAEKGQHAIPESDVTEILVKELHANISTTRHKMTELGWKRQKVKWSGNSFSKVIWVEEGYHVVNGKIYGPDGYEQDLGKHFEHPCLLNAPVVLAAADTGNVWEELY